ncbi:hypothetical protein SAMN04490243_0799 [Robiginitalea myxolifaciens]|uniref:Uncharacterized protein n=1 Tax=Robiginitalea myxolifaciens TaxID=400055 RepID=A0A1I6FW96_9FLAO|nr:hypothetical protein SAMN04490243_0799 [Robiginitalea myxolifaciens]
MIGSVTISSFLKKMSFSKSRLSRFKAFARKFHDRYLGKIEIIIIIALIGYIIGLTIFLIVLW